MGTLEAHSRQAQSSWHPALPLGLPRAQQLCSWIKHRGYFCVAGGLNISNIKYWETRRDGRKNLQQAGKETASFLLREKAPSTPAEGRDEGGLHLAMTGPRPPLCLEGLLRALCPPSAAGPPGLSPRQAFPGLSWLCFFLSRNLSCSQRQWLLVEQTPFLPLVARRRSVVSRPRVLF